uniref:Uncharacterized protein n=1 Tax=Oryza brachyantha TaxID=4533 RepID=J3MTN3_ORYBR
MELGLSLGEAVAVADGGGRAPELVLGLGVGPRSGEEDEAWRREDGVGARRWAAAAASPEPSVRLSLVSSLGLHWASESVGVSRVFLKLCSFRCTFRTTGKICGIMTPSQLNV